MISPENKKDLLNTAEEKVKFIFEDLDQLDSLGDRHFLDPILYCFNATYSDGTNKKIITTKESDIDE